MKEGIRIKLNGKELETQRTVKESMPYEIEFVVGKEGVNPLPGSSTFPGVWKLADWLLIE
ncbi:hypothetical protein [Ammoniphilus sp. YIM 78166]|uniref:hypothetical protein n=1 Tax=Ammoniphilus sp. YIM 78166 TaxID=1644106 RepID=UPI00106FC0D5|nr:hypothetical protein [Ammoniphilus sp. YIM 78166]